VLDALVGFGQGIVDRVFDAGGGRANQFDFLVSVMITLGSSPKGRLASVAVNVRTASGDHSYLKVQIYCTF
jgi:hypothetical protein